MMYYYFHNQFHNAFLDSVSYELDDELLHMIKHETIEIKLDSFKLNTHGNFQFVRANNANSQIGISNCHLFVPELRSQEADFMGFLYFSKPRYRILDNGITEYYVSISIDNGVPKDCLLKLTVKNDKISGISHIPKRLKLIR
jgi:hypothetical protein